MQLTLPYDQFVEEAVKGINDRYQKAEKSLYDLAKFVQEKVIEGVSYGKSKQQVYRDLSTHQDFKLSEKTLKKYEITQNFLDEAGSPASLPITTVTEIAESSLSQEDKETIMAVAEDKEMTREEVRKEIKLKQRENIQVNKPQIPEGEFNVIYADPPWRYEFSESDAREIENQYPTMELEEIKSMELPKISEDAVLLLWATAPKLEEALSVLNAWGFTYRTCAVWDKEKIGMGYWFRGQHEILLVGVRGNMRAPDPSVRVSSVYRESRGAHSKKPEYFISLIESYFPGANYVELFSRTRRPLWSSYGNQLPD